MISIETKEHANEEQNEETEQDPPEEQNPTEEQQTITLCLPYAGEKGEQIVKKLKKKKHPEFMPKCKGKHHLHSQETRIEISSQGQDKDRTHA